jgi:hypothetical protein
MRAHCRPPAWREAPTPVTGLEIGYLAEASRLDDAPWARYLQYQTKVPGARVHRRKWVKSSLARKREVAVASVESGGSSEPIVYIDHSDIRQGSLDELKRAVKRIVDFIDAREPQLITYGFYIDEAAAKMTVVAVHPDSASLERHLDIGGPEFLKVAPLLKLTAIECYGRPTANALEQLQRKAAAMGEGGTVVTLSRFAGFERAMPTFADQRTLNR